MSALGTQSRHSTSGDGSGGASWERVKAPILVVDDDSDLRGELRSLLEEEGYSVLEAENGREALDLLVSSHNPEPFLVVLDLGMPVVSGPELLKIMRSYWRLSTIPVLVISGAELPRGLREGGGVIMYLPKPLDAPQFLAIVKEHAAQVTAPSDEFAPPSRVVQVERTNARSPQSDSIDDEESKDVAGSPELTSRRSSTMPSPPIPSVVLISPGRELLRACLETVHQIDDMPRVEIAELPNVATVVSRCRPFAVVLSEDIFPFDPGEFEALARDVGTELIIVDVAKDAHAIAVALLPRLRAAFLRWEVREYVLR